MRKLLWGMIFLFVLLQNGRAQSQIKGVVFSDRDVPVSFANVLLLRTADTLLVKGAITGNDGIFLVENVAPGAYLLEISMIGYQTYRTTPFEIQNTGLMKDLGKLTVKEDVMQLETVEIVGKKPPFEQKIDRLVINVENSITSAGATALEILERSPGVVVNRQNNSISVAGKDGVIVMMNGKINRMPIDAVVQLLAGMPSSNIQKIELITTPPANFDAEGNAGYINIVLKQSSDLGLNGSYTFSGGFGKGDVSSAGINFNYRKKGFNLYGDYAFSREAQAQIFSFSRQVLLNEQTVGTNTVSDREPVQRNHNARLGLDFNLNQKTVLGVLISSYDNRWSMDAVNHTTLTLNGLPDTLLTIVNDEINYWQHLAGNFNLQHTFREGETLTLDADYLSYDNDNPTNYLNSYADGAEQFLFDRQTFSGKRTPIQVSVGNLNYTKQLSKKIKMEAGVKGTLSSFDNDVTVSTINNGILINDPSLTAKYNLKESIGAAFTSFDVTLDGKTNLKLGLRYEYTNSNLGSVEQANIVDRHYGNFFPSFFLSRTFSEEQSANFSCSRRITRPTFKEMAPFVIFWDPYTFSSGNPALQPSISNNVKLDYRFKTALFSVQYTFEDSAIARFQTRVIEGTNQQIGSSQNMKNRQTAAFTVAFPVQVTKWWNMQNNFIGTWQKLNTFLDGDPVQTRTQNLQVSWINSFTLPKNFSAELVGFYRTKALSGTVVVRPMGALDMGIQKKFNGKFGTLRFGIDDVLNSLKFQGELNYPQYNLVSKSIFDFSQRTFKLSYSRNFGNNELKGTRQRGTGSEEERQRVN